MLKRPIRFQDSPSAFYFACDLRSDWPIKEPNLHKLLALCHMRQAFIYVFLKGRDRGQLSYGCIKCVNGPDLTRQLLKVCT